MKITMKKRPMGILGMILAVLGLLFYPALIALGIGVYIGSSIDIELHGTRGDG